MDDTLPDEEDEANQQWAQLWDLTEAEFKKADEQITPELVQDKARLVAIFVGLIERCQEHARRLAPRHDEMEVYNAIYPEYSFAAAETTEYFEIINEAAYAAEHQ